MIEPLTDKKIKAAKADNKDLYLFDGGGLYLQVCVSNGVTGISKRFYQDWKDSFSLDLEGAGAKNMYIIIF